MTPAPLLARWRQLAATARERARLYHTDPADLGELAALLTRERAPARNVAAEPADRALFCSLRWTCQAFAQADAVRRASLSAALGALAAEALAVIGVMTGDAAGEAAADPSGEAAPTLRYRADIDG